MSTGQNAFLISKEQTDFAVNKSYFDRQITDQLMYLTFEPRSEKTGLRGFRPGLTETGLCSYRR